jgi:hypothetical protein
MWNPKDIVGYDKGDFVTFHKDNVTKDNISFRGFDDPKKLKDGEKYKVTIVEVYSSYTDVYLEGFKDKRFNSIWFLKDE